MPIILISILLFSSFSFAGTINLKNAPRYFQGIDERAIGLLDKGQLSNMVTNYGIISDFHLGTPALHWPRNGSDVQHYGF